MTREELELRTDIHDFTYTSVFYVILRCESFEPNDCSRLLRVT